MKEVTLLAGLMSTTLFVVSYLPMLHRALRTRDLGSYSRPSLVLANVGNVVQSVYVYSLPAGPIWFLHTFYLVASALMLALHIRHLRPDTTQTAAAGTAGSGIATSDVGTPLEPALAGRRRPDYHHFELRRTP